MCRCLILDCCFFFFKQKTAYEMRISDWSSDVCSSDLRDRSAEMAAVPGVGGVIGQIPLPAELHRAGMAGGRRNGFQDHPPPSPRPQWRGGGDRKSVV